MLEDGGRGWMLFFRGEKQDYSILFVGLQLHQEMLNNYEVRAFLYSCPGGGFLDKEFHF